MISNLLGQLDLQQIVSAFIVLFAVIDIFGSTPIIINLKKQGRPVGAWKASSLSGALLLGFFFAGDAMLRLFSVDISSFAVAGALVIFLMALEMILDITIFKNQGPIKEATLVPVVFPLIAGAGSFTTLLSLKAEFHSVNIITALVLNMLCVYIVIRATDWVERKILTPKTDRPAHMDKYFRVAEMSAKRYGLRIRKFKNAREIREGKWAQKLFDVVNKAYAPLYGYSEMTPRQIDQYVREYMPFLDMRLVTAVEEEATGRVVAMGVGMPSLSRALQKAKSKLFPFGWWHLAKALYFKHADIVDLLLVAVLPEFQNKGVNALLFADLIPVCQQMGFKFGETHPQLETNEKSQGQWAYLDAEIHKRRRCWQKAL